MKLSQFGEKYTGRSGIVELMEDLGKALQINPDIISMGGGNPARIPAVEATFQRILKDICEDAERVNGLLGKYQPPQGDNAVLEQVAGFLGAEYGWPLTRRNVAISNGGQSAFFVLSNLLAGRFADGSLRRIQMPLVPEYLGYTDAGLERNFYSATIPKIDILEEHLFKYRVDFDALKVTADTAAFCISRPTNPTGNVLTDGEVAHLDRLARQHDIPFIIDGAYGTPFPDIIFTEVTPHWNENTILLLSLSKLGLPGVRTGFIIAGEEVVEAYTTANTVLNLACGNLGPALGRELFRNGEIRHLSRNLVMPWYRDRALQTMEWIMQRFGDLPYYIHKPEGAIFLWVWFPDLPITSQELYLRLKSRGVLVIPGHDSFPGIRSDWAHARQCIRLSYAQDSELVKEGIGIMAAELKAIYRI